MSCNWYPHGLEKKDSITFGHFIAGPIWTNVRFMHGYVNIIISYTTDIFSKMYGREWIPKIFCFVYSNVPIVTNIEITI